MFSSVLPSFTRYPKEAAIIGRLLAGYGELEYELANCVGDALGDSNTAFRVLFRTRGEDQRIQTSDALVRPTYEKLKLTDSWAKVKCAMLWCKKIRNQYAHCHWYDDEGGLFFYRLEVPAKTELGELNVTFLHVDVPLLEQQEEYFRYALDGLTYLHLQFRVLSGTLRYHASPAPEKKHQPPAHNPPEKHRIQLGQIESDMPLTGHPLVHR